MKFVEYYYFTITTYRYYHALSPPCLLVRFSDIPRFLPPSLSQAFVDGREKPFPSTELAFYRKRKERESGKRKDGHRTRKKKVKGGKIERTHLALREFAFSSRLIWDILLVLLGGNAWLLAFLSPPSSYRGGRGQAQREPTDLHWLASIYAHSIIGSEDGELERKINK